MVANQRVRADDKVVDSRRLEEWLADRGDLAATISLRAALRVLPLVCAQPLRQNANSHLMFHSFRTAFIVWATQKYEHYAHDAARAAASVAAHYADADGTTPSAASASHAAVYAADTYAGAYSAAAYAAAAAASAEAATGHTDAGVVWESIASDIYWIEENASAAISLSNGLLGKRLWINEVRGDKEFRLNFPVWARQPWNLFRDSIEAKETGSDIWIHWYESVLAGRKGGCFDKRLTGVVERDLIIRVALETKAFWERDAALVNRDIKGWIAEAKKERLKSLLAPQIPDVRPAAIEPRWQNGKLIVPDVLLPSDLDESSLVAALVALREDLTELADDAEEVQNIDLRPAEYLRRLALRIPDTLPSQVLLFRLGHAHEVLNDFARTTDLEWPDLFAARYRRLALQYERIVRQFPKWRAFVRNAAEKKLTTEQIMRVSEVVDTVVRELRADDASEFIDPAIPNALQAAQMPIVEWQETLRVGSEQLAEDLLESVNNVLKRTAEFALALKSNGIDPAEYWLETTATESVKAFSKEARKSIVKEFGNLGKSTGPAFGRFLRRLPKITTRIGIPVGGSALLLQGLFRLYPDTFGWLAPVLRFLHLL